MSTTAIYYFTGTGNTARAVGLIAERLRGAGHTVTLFQAKDGAVPPQTVFDCHIVAFPVLSWAAPVMMKRYLRQLQRAMGAKVCVLAVFGATITGGTIRKGSIGQALQQVEHILASRGYDVYLTAGAMFPHNWTQVSNPCSAEGARKILLEGDREAALFADDVLTDRRHRYRCGWFNYVWSFALAVLFGFLGRRILGKFYIADETCGGCGLCAKVCPAKTIGMWRGKPYWTTSCEDCNRCINACPTGSIQVSVPLLAFYTVLHTGLAALAAWVIVVWGGSYLPASRVVRVVVEGGGIALAYFGLLWAICVPIDAVMRVFLRHDGIRRFLAQSYTHRFSRYTAPGYKPLKD